VVGNDIIDISETRRSTNWERPRFLQKIFTTTEQDFINAAVDPFTTVWHLWSMKESAYKVFIQSGSDRFFNPSRIECTVDSLKSGQVKIGETSIKTETTTNSKYIFTTAVLDSSESDNCVFKLADSCFEFQSIYMQSQVLSAFSKNNSLDSTELRIQKTTTGIPTILHKNKPLNCSLSITHHGNYGAYSILNK
jgi:phosphopantetheinyl transferase (holo-ACP synthase)